MRFSRFITIVRLGCLLAGCSALLYGQGSVTIFGAVTDPSGAAVSGATVTVLNTGTGTSRQTASGVDGGYVVSQLPIGVYSVSATAAGFKKFVQDDIRVTVDENRRVNLQLQVGALTESVTVQAEPVQVETRSGTLREVIDSARIVELPLNGRNALQLQYLVAGSGGVVTAGQEQNDSVSINGSRPNTNNYTLDGADNHDPYFNTPAVFPNPDALEEFSLQTSSYAADRGRNAGAIMNAVTRSGTNTLHGTLFEFLRNEKLNARNFFSATVPPFKRNQFGGTLGGPVRKDKTFFFGFYQRTAERSSPGSVNPTLISAAQREGNWSGVSAALKDPRGGVFPNNIIPASRLSKASQNFLAAFVPVPTRADGLYPFASQQKIDDHQAIGKVDHILSEKNRLSGRFLYNWNSNFQVANNTSLPGFLAQIKYRNYSAAGTDTYILSPNLINTFTFGYNQIDRDQLSIVPGNKSWTDFGAGFVRAFPGDPVVGFDTNVNGYFRPQARYPLHHYRKSFQISEGMNWTRGAHFLRYGVDIRRDLLKLQENFQCDPAVVFRATFTGNAAADFLLGLPSSFTQIAPTANNPRTTEIGAYFQDDWTVSRRLTLNLGLRWDPFFPNSDPEQRFAQVRLGQQSVKYPSAPLGYVFPGDPGVPASTIETQYQDWGPRFGFAFDPMGNGRMSIRGGYGIFYSQVRQQANNQVSNDQPFAIQLSVTNPTGGLDRPYADTGNPFPFQEPRTQQEKAGYKFLTPLNVTQWDWHFRNAIAQQWNLTVQRELPSSMVATAAYVGSKGNHLFIGNEMNPAVYGKAGNTVDARRLYYPTFSNITNQTSDGSSIYHALQLTLNKRLTHGLTVLANYTWSKFIDLGSTDGFTPQNPFNIRAERAVSTQDIPHRFVGSFIYQLPALRNAGRVLRHTLGGWEVNGIVTFWSGEPFSVTSGRDNSGNAVNQDRPNVVGDWRIGGDRSKNDRILKAFNTAAFAQNLAGTFGNAGRNILRGDFRNSVDLGVIKDFRVTERHRLQFRGEFFNLANHANLGNPAGGLSSPSFGRITTAGNPRVIQFALKYAF